MGAKDSKSSSSAEKIGKEECLKDEKLQPRTRKHLTQKFEGRLQADAEDFSHASSQQSGAFGVLDAAGVYPVLDGKYSDQKDAKWVEFLVNKEKERVRRSQAKVPVAAPKPPILLHTSEYLKLLKTGQEQKGRKGKADNAGKAPFPKDFLFKVPPRPRNTDISAAVDEIIQYRCKEAETGKSVGPVASKDELLFNIVKMFESKGASTTVASKKNTALEVRGVDGRVMEEVGVASTQDDLQIDKLNRDEDLAEPMYWSDDERVPGNGRLASAHKLGHRPRYDPATIREYVMQDLDSQLDHEVAKLLLHAQRLSNRHKAFDPTPPSPQNPQTRRYIVTGLKEVCRAIRVGRVKCVFIAPDIEDATTNGGVDNRLRDILRAAYEKDVPVVYSLSRTRMGVALGKSLKMSVLGLLETKGVQLQFDRTLSLANQKRKSWMETLPKA